MIRVPDLGNVEMRYLYALLIQDKVEFLAWRTTGIGGQAARICTAQTGSSQEQIDFVFAPEGIEVTSDNDRFCRW